MHIMYQFNAFISYSHAADGKLAPALQTALEKFAKPWYKLRNLNLFRDETSLSASPHLWPNIIQALGQSEYLIYMASPEAAKSKWVHREIDYWLKNKSLETILIVLTDGDINWDDDKAIFNDSDLNSLPANLIYEFKVEPFYIDLKSLKTAVDVSLKNPIFKRDVLKLAAQLHGKEPKDLASDEVRSYSRMILVRNSASVILIALLALFIYQTFVAISERNKAQGNYLISEANREVESNPTLALRLAEEALKKNNSPTIYRYASRIYSDNSFYKNKIIKGAMSIDFSPTGDSILTGSINGEIRLVDLRGNILKDYKKFKNWVKTVAFSHKGNLIVAGSYDSIVRIYTLKGDILFEDTMSSNVTAVAFSPVNEYMIITGTLDGKVTLFDLKMNTKHEFDNSHTDGVTSVVFSPTGDTILTGSYDTKAILWRANGDILQVFNGHTDGITSVDFSPDGKSILTGSRDTTALLYNLAVPNRIGQIFKRGHSMQITSVAFSPNGETILTGSFDNSALLWNRKGKILKKFNIESPYFDSELLSVVFSRDGEKLLTAKEYSYILLWDLIPESIYDFIDPGKEVAFSLAFSPNGKKFLAGNYDGSICLWDLETKSIIQRKKVHSDRVASIAFSPDGKTFLTGSWDGKSYLMNLDFTKIREFQGHNNRVNAVEFSPFGDTILTGSEDGFARMWNLEGLEPIKTFDQGSPISSVAFSCNGNILTGGDISPFLWDMKGNKSDFFKGHNSNISSLAFSIDGRYILAGSDDYKTSLWDLKGNIKSEYPAHNNSVNAVEFSPDGKTVLTCSADGYVFLSDFYGNPIKKFVGHTDRVNTITFAPDGKTFLSASWDGIIRLWNVKLPLKDFLKSNSIAPLTAGDKERFNIDN